MILNAENGAEYLRAEYDSWGVVTEWSLNGGLTSEPDLSAWPIPHGFAGGLVDRDTGLVRFGARDYDPSVGRWTAKDPILFQGGQANLYVYVGNDPVNFTDPEGEIAQIAIGTGIGALAGAGYAFFTGGNVLAGAASGAALGFTVSTFGAAGALLAAGGAGVGVQATVGAVGFGTGVALRVGVSSAQGSPEGIGEASLKQAFSGIGGLFNPFGSGVSSEIVNQASGFATDAAAEGICE